MVSSDLLRQNRGSTLLMTAIIIAVVGGCLVLAVDLMRLFLVKNELRRTADAGALAAAQKLLQMPPGAKGLRAAVPDCSRSYNACQAIVGANQADGAAVQLLPADVVFGQWDKSFKPTGCSPPQQVDAVQVRVRKDPSANGAVPLFFAGFLPGDLGRVPLSAQAVGLSGYVGRIPRGGGAFPLALGADKVPLQNTGAPIRIDLNPTTRDNGCWHTFDDKSASAQDLRGLVNGSTPSPEIRVGDLIKVTEGVANSVLQEVAQEFAKRGNDWTVLAVVISGDTHTGWTQVLGFTPLRLTVVDAHGTDKRLEGYTVENQVAPGTDPGGSNYGLRAASPKLVQ